MALENNLYENKMSDHHIYKKVEMVGAPTKSMNKQLKIH